MARAGCSQCSLGSLLASLRRCALLAEPLRVALLHRCERPAYGLAQPSAHLSRPTIIIPRFGSLAGQKGWGRGTPRLRCSPIPPPIVRIGTRPAELQLKGVASAFPTCRLRARSLPLGDRSRGPFFVARLATCDRCEGELCLAASGSPSNPFRLARGAKLPVSGDAFGFPTLVAARLRGCVRWAQGFFGTVCQRE